MSYAGNTTARLFPVKPPLPASNWTLRQTGVIASLVDRPGNILRLTQAGRISGDDVVMADVALSNAAHTATMGFVPEMGFGNYAMIGMTLYETSSAKYVFYGFYSTATGDTFMTVRYATGLTGGALADFTNNGYNVYTFGGRLIYLRLRDDGVTRYYDFSTDGGQTFQNIYSQARATHFTSIPNRIGFGINPTNFIASGIYVHHYRLTYP